MIKELNNEVAQAFMATMLDYYEPVTKVIIQDSKFDELMGSIEILFSDINDTPTEYEVYIDTIDEDFFYAWNVAIATTFGLDLKEGLIYYIRYE